MRPAPTANRPWLTLALGLLTTICATSHLSQARATSIDSLVVGATPLILKDGRIAQVTVHKIPFEAKKGDLGSSGLADLDALITPMATDCFLTAQAIGHVAPGANADGDTLSAHRLARARADMVQAALIRKGLPANSVASVWDWQFLVKESRVTLWVFRLHENEDCEGKALEGAAVASLEPPEVTKKAAEPERIPEPVVEKAPKPAPDTPRKLTKQDEIKLPAATDSGSEPVQVTEIKPLPTQPAAPASTPEPEQAAPLPSAATTAETVEPAPQPAPREVAAVEQPADLTEPPALTSDAPSAAAAPAEVNETAEPRREPAAQTAAVTTEPVTLPGDAAGGATGAVVFDVNSSYFPSNAGSELRSFLAKLGEGGAYEIAVTGAVGSGDVKGVDSAEAARYNRWMAERRVDRVVEWLEKNAGDRKFELRKNLRENDSSRAVVMEARPAS